MGVRLVAAVCSVAAGVVMVTVAAVWTFGAAGLAAAGGVLMLVGLVAVPVTSGTDSRVRGADGFVETDAGGWR